MWVMNFDMEGADMLVARVERVWSEGGEDDPIGVIDHLDRSIDW